MSLLNTPASEQSSTDTPSSTNLDNTQLKQLKAIGHELSTVVTIGNNGVSPSVLEEISRALKDHELIKIKLPAGSKEERGEMAQAIATQTQAQLVQTIGRMALLLKHNPNANAKLSNLSRHGA